jgi:hypothetical protein
VEWPVIGVHAVAGVLCARSAVGSFERVSRAVEGVRRSFIGWAGMAGGSAKRSSKAVGERSRVTPTVAPGQWRSGRRRGDDHVGNGQGFWPKGRRGLWLRLWLLGCRQRRAAYGRAGGRPCVATSTRADTIKGLTYYRLI